MQRDIRGTNLYGELRKFCSDVRQPGKKQISDAVQIRASPDGRHAAFAGTVAECLDEEPTTRVVLADLATGTLQFLRAGPGMAKLPCFSPDGRMLAFLSDRGKPSGFQLSLVDINGAGVREAAAVNGSIEQLQWSSDGTRILLNVVGSERQSSRVEELPPWLPSIEPGGEDCDTRSCWIYETRSDSLRPVDFKDCNTWEAAWCGADALVVVASDEPGEGHWYSAYLRSLDLKSGSQRTFYRPTDQLGSPAVSPDGRWIAVVEGLCSDRGPVVGDLRLIDSVSGDCLGANTQGVDVAYVQWCSERHLLLSGSRGLDAVIGFFDLVTGQFHETWSSQELTVPRPNVCALETPGDCVIIAEGFAQAPELAVLRGGHYRRIVSFDVGYTEAMRSLESVERVIWPAADGLDIQGWLLRPRARPPFPVIFDVHGGPVGHWKPTFLVRRMLHVPLLLSRGFAVFLPNPRGSTGRGQEFARKVMGDLGGADALDLLRGLDVLIERGIADGARIGVNGTSYGGFMAARLITQTARFAAAVAVSPHTNQVTAELLSNIPQFMSRLIDDVLANPHGRYFERSPVLHASGTKTPVLNICGALDRCTPPEEAIQFHQALIKGGARSVLVTYPHEGHGIRRLPAMLDCATRIAAWFIEHIPVRP